MSGYRFLSHGPDKSMRFLLNLFAMDEMSLTDWFQVFATRSILFNLVVAFAEIRVSSPQQWMEDMFLIENKTISWYDVVVLQFTQTIFFI